MDLGAPIQLKEPVNEQALVDCALSAVIDALVEAEGANTRTVNLPWPRLHDGTPVDRRIIRSTIRQRYIDGSQLSFPANPDAGSVRIIPTPRGIPLTDVMIENAACLTELVALVACMAHRPILALRARRGFEKRKWSASYAKAICTVWDNALSAFIDPDAPRSHPVSLAKEAVIRLTSHPEKGFNAQARGGKGLVQLSANFIERIALSPPSSRNHLWLAFVSTTLFHEIAHGFQHKYWRKENLRRYDQGRMKSPEKGPAYFRQANEIHAFAFGHAAFGYLRGGASIESADSYSPAFLYSTLCGDAAFQLRNPYAKQTHRLFKRLATHAEMRMRTAPCMALLKREALAGVFCRDIDPSTPAGALDDLRRVRKSCQTPPFLMPAL